MADNEEFLTCPACGKNMVKAYITSANRNVDICLDGCGGIFFDNRELEKFDETHEDASDILLFYDDGREYLRVSDTKRICPVCNAPMHKVGTGVEDNSFQIDNCYTCGGKFLDYGELQKIRNSQQLKLRMPENLQSYKTNETTPKTKLIGYDKPPSLRVAAWLTEIIVKHI